MKLTRGTYFSVATLAGAALMLESTLTRLLAVAQYYHFAFLVISLALLGFGASGSILTLFSPRGLKKDGFLPTQSRDKLLILSGCGFAGSLMVAYLVINWLPFDSYSIAWDRSQVINFVLYYLVLTLPFLFAGLGIGAVLSSSPGENNRVYAVNLFGSGAGIILGLLVMELAGVPGALIACGMVGLSAILGSREILSRMVLGVTYLLLAVGVISLVVTIKLNMEQEAPVGINISPYKGLPYAHKVPGAKAVLGAWNAISRIDVISGASTHVLPGLSYAYQGQLPEQLGMAFDGDALRPITLIEAENFQVADYLPEAFAFHLHPGGDTLVVDAGSGLGVLQAIRGGAGDVVALIDNQLITQAMASISAMYDVYSRPEVQTEVLPSRVYLAAADVDFDVIFLPLNEPYRPVANGAYSLAEDYRLTLESLQEVLSQLKQDGTLVVTRWLQTPPSEELRMLATLIEALRRRGIEDPADKLVAYRGIQTMTFLVNPGGWDNEQLREMREFAADRRFDLVWAPGMSIEEANRFNKLEQAVYFEQFREFLAADDLEYLYATSPYAIQPARDDHPFFYHFFKWEQAPQVLAVFGRVWQPFGGSGYFVLVALLLLVSILSLILIVVPLLVRRSSWPGQVPPAENNHQQAVQLPSWKILVYFGSIGIAFLFIEIPLIQSSILFFGQPAYAFGFVVLVLLICSSLGSFYSRHMWERRKVLLLLLVAVALVTALVFRQLMYTSLGWVEGLRVVVLAASLVPLGILMGLPFPFGLKWLEDSGSTLTPWAWAVNGCASVIAAVAAALVSLSSGFMPVLLIGAVLYAVAAILMR